METLDKVMSFMCKICPLCICARQNPDSRIAKLRHKISKACPFCIAHAKLSSKKTDNI